MSYEDEVNNTISESSIATYNKKNKRFYSLEPLVVASDGTGILKMKIKKNGNLVVQFMEGSQNCLVYITELQKY